MNAEERELNEKILADTVSFYHGQLPSEVRSYLLVERAITEEMITRFMLGHAHGGLKEHLLNGQNYPENACLESGVLKKQDGGEIQDFFFNRIIFPNIKNGKVVFAAKASCITTGVVPGKDPILTDGNGTKRERRTGRLNSASQKNITPNSFHKFI